MSAWVAVLTAMLAAASSAPHHVAAPAAASPLSAAAANAHDDAWQPQWAANARLLLANRSATVGGTAFVLQIGDSITYANPCKFHSRAIDAFAPVLHP